jgi:predicted PhzF superfamily epimerase YddE/YHI9
MRLPLYQVDAFAERPFAGNPAAVVPLARWLPEATLQAIAMENNLSETAYLVPNGERYALRWFTPTREVDLCGHATLASAYVVYEHLGCRQPLIRFDTASGELTVTRAGAWLWMDFPADPPAPVSVPEGLAVGLGLAPRAVLGAADYVAVYESEDAVLSLKPDYRVLAGLDRRGVIATALGRQADFVSRFFAPKHGIDEDPVTGSAHCTLAPFWSARLGRRALTGRQLSRRGGVVRTADHGARVHLGGQVLPYLAGEIVVPEA